ncbi:hypothetical protein D3C73_1151880 [compost metagenome]
MLWSAPTRSSEISARSLTVSEISWLCEDMSETEASISENDSPAAIIICLPSVISVVDRFMVSPALSIWFTMRLTSWPICAADLADRSASLRTEPATTANPRPSSPARAASIAAFSDNRFVSSAILAMVPTIFSISLEWLPSVSMIPDKSLMLSLTICIWEVVESIDSRPLRALSALPAAVSFALSALLAISVMNRDIS